MYISFLFCLIVCILTVWIWWLRKCSSPDQPPLLSGMLPVIGHAHLLLGDTINLWTKIKKHSYECTKKGGVVRLYIGSNLHYLITDPDDIQTVANACLQKHYAYGFAKPFFGDGLVTGSGAIWSRHRKLLNPAFNLHLLYGFLGIFNSQARKLVEEVSREVNQGPFNISTFLRNLTLGTIYMTAFGITIEGNETFYNTYMETVDKILAIIMLRFQRCWLYNNFIYKLSGWRKTETEYVRILNNVTDLVIEKKKLAMKENNKNTISETEENTEGLKFKPLLDLLLELSDEDKLSDKEIREEIDTAIVAGFDTSSWAMTYALIVLGSYPEIQERVYNELRDVVGDSDRDVNKDDLNRLVYTEAVLKEVLRLYSVGPILLRYVNEDVTLKYYTMRAGSSCVMMFYGLHRHPVWGPDAEEFKPERWLDPNTLPSKNIFGGFSIGKRSCIGKSYALISMKTTLVHLLRKYKVEADVTKLVCKLDFILKPASGYYVSLKRRESDGTVYGK